MTALLIGAALLAAQDGNTDWVLAWWLAHPKEWGSHPFTIVAGLLAIPIVIGVFVVAFWIRDKFWPS